MPKSHRKGGRQGRRKNPNSNAGKSFAADHVTGSMVDLIRVPADYSRRRRGWQLSETPPRSIRDQIVWFEANVVFASSFGISSSPTSVTELNLSFSLTNWLEYSYFVQLFDQFCIHSVVVNITTEAVFTAVAGAGRCTTAIDYDNVTNLGSEAAIIDYASSETATVVPHMNIQRYLEPCVTPALYLPSSTGYGSQRMWVDCASSSTPHYGFRALFTNNNVSGFTVDCIGSMRIGARNQI